MTHISPFSFIPGENLLNPCFLSQGDLVSSRSGSNGIVQVNIPELPSGSNISSDSLGPARGVAYPADQGSAPVTPTTTTAPPTTGEQQPSALSILSASTTVNEPYLGLALGAAGGGGGGGGGASTSAIAMGTNPNPEKNQAMLLVQSSTSQVSK